MSIPFVPTIVIISLVMLSAFLVVIQANRGDKRLVPFRWPAFLVMMVCAGFLIWNLGQVIGVSSAALGTG